MSLSNLSILTIQEIRGIVRQNQFSLPHFAPILKETLLNYIAQNAPAEVLAALRNRAQEKEEHPTKRNISSENKQEYDESRRQRRRIEEYRSVKGRSEYKSADYLEIPTMEQVKACYKTFYNATSNNAVKQVVCGVCGREVGVVMDDVRTLNLEDLPNNHRIVPHETHPCHVLFDGKLLEPAGVRMSDEGRYRVNVCHQCLSSLENTKNNLPPAFSLANNMWIGSIPIELSSLTFPEQLLISHLYPRVYIFKLYPKKGGGVSPEKLQRGMRGTVSTFELNMDNITSMLEGRLMPRRTSILASLISVTYIGLGRLPKRWLHQIFRVRRHNVFIALQWLKINNKKYYGDITISQDVINTLPEDDVPVELLSIVRQSNDVGIVDQESAGYVPENEVERRDDDDDDDDEGVDGIMDNVDHQAVFQLNDNDNSSEDGDSRTIANESETDDEQPDVIPLQVTGSIDVDLTNLTAKELMSWGLANLWQEGGEGTYAVRHGKKPVNDFGQPRPGEEAEKDRPNFFEKAFPCLFPYGCGGIEADRVVDVNFSAHVKWALAYHDRRFRRHETFPFVSFGILQRRQALGSARLQMNQQQFEREAHLLATVTAEKLQKACDEEERGLSISDPVVRRLQQNVYATSSRVKGSNQQRLNCRGMIWSTCIMKNPASLWITINPTDLHDPIAQIYAGEDINLDNFLSTIGPNIDQRTRNIAADPYAAAKFFHFIIQTILETLFGVKVTNFQVYNKTGIMGRVSCYFGLVETQGRGTLHFHLFLWLENAPTADEIMELLKSEEFRLHVADYIQQNLRAYLPGLESKDSIKAIRRRKDIAYSRPIDPEGSNYDQELADFELQLARTEQIHTCRRRQCLVEDKRTGDYRCKRRAPFELSDVDSIEENGNWHQKRLYGYVNGWIPGILVNVRCNNDAKLLTHGTDTKKTARYATTYAAKKQGRNFNASAVMAKTYAYHLDNLQSAENYVDGIRDVQRLLLFRIVHALNREQELAAPLVVSYLMGWDDTYHSHHYSPIYWSSFVHALLQSFPEFRTSQKSFRSQSNNEQQTNLQDLTVEAVRPDDEEFVADNHAVTIDISSTGVVYAKSQVTDYSARGDRLEGFNVVSLFTDTYESRKNRHYQVEEEAEQDISTSTHSGRPRNEYVSYHSEHPKANVVHRIIRSKNHNNLPNFIGQKFPQSNDPETYDFYCASMLMLLKPWRNLRSDLKNADETWTDAFKKFLATSSSEIKAIVSGIQYIHDCDTAVREDQEARPIDSRRTWTAEGNNHENFDVDGEVDFMQYSEVISTEQELDAVIRAQVSVDEELHGRLAIEFAKRARIFCNEGEEDIWDVSDGNIVIGNATGDDLAMLSRWRRQLKIEVARINEDDNFPNEIRAEDRDTGGVLHQSTNLPFHGDVVPLNDANRNDDAQYNEYPNESNSVLLATDPSNLNVDQRRAYDIIIWHLEQDLAGHNPPPLRMNIHGEGGTGKSKVLQTVSQGFQERGCKHRLLKAAYTGVAASLIEGKTTHVIGGISAAMRSFDVENIPSDVTKAKLEAFWLRRDYTALDEMSMLAKDFFALLSRNAAIGRGNNTQSFGGMNVIILGDFHQFPPVARPIRAALYYPSNAETDSLAFQIGREIYEEFDIVVTLKEQKRITDPVWQTFLQNLRQGKVNSGDIRMLKSLVIGKGTYGEIDFAKSPWKDAALITPRHAVRMQWNQAALRKMCRESGRTVFICTAEDTFKGRPIGLQEKYILEKHRGKNKRSSHSKDLSYKIEFAIGMKVMVTDNVETDLDITNGARGEIVDIVLHPDEPAINRGTSVISLKYLPAYILVKLSRTRINRLAGLDDYVVPVEPSTTSYRIQVPIAGNMVNRTVKRRQYPITAAYAFTDYRSQGQTIPYVIVDIATPPTGGLNLFNLYVALSRSAGRETIRLLRDFDEKLLQQKHNSALIEEDERLDILDKKTNIWYERVVRS